MDRKQLLATLSLLALSLGGATAPAQAQSSSSNIQAEFDRCEVAPGPEQTEEDCACAAALQENTIEALEEFLRRYPQNGNEPNACLALAALQNFTITNNDRDPPGPPGPAPY